MNMNAIDIDISKRKSTVAVLRPDGKDVVKPFDIPHFSADFQSLKKLIRELGGETRFVMECTGRYYEPVARELSQANFFCKRYESALSASSTLLISMPIPTLTARSQGRPPKKGNFIGTNSHVDCIRKMSLESFTDHYQKCCSRRKYNFSKSTAEEIYGKVKGLIPVLPKDTFTKRMIKQGGGQLNATSQTVKQLRALIRLPEYLVIMAMKGVGAFLGFSLWLRSEM